MNIPHRRLTFIAIVALLSVSCTTTQVPRGSLAANEKLVLQPIDNGMPPNAPNVYDISKVTLHPAAVFQARPRYPLELRRANVSGEGVTLFTVAKDGTVKDAVIVRATDVRFGEAALEAVRQWRFRPAEVNGTVVECRMMVPIVFTLNER